MKLVITLETTKTDQSSVSLAELEQGLDLLRFKLGLVCFPVAELYLVSEFDLKEFEKDCTNVEECIEAIKNKGAINK